MEAQKRKHGSMEARKRQLIPISSSIIDIGMNSVHEGFSVVIVGIGGISRSSSWLVLSVVTRKATVGLVPMAVFAHVCIHLFLR